MGKPLRQPTQVVVETRNVGQAFGCEGVVRYANNRRTVHTTAVFPHKFETAAFNAAKAWAEVNDYQVLDLQED